MNKEILYKKETVYKKAGDEVVGKAFSDGLKFK